MAAEGLVEMEILDTPPGGIAPLPPATLLPAPPADQRPALVYLADLSQGSRATMRRDLDAIARLLRCHDALSCPWHELRFQHTALIRSALADHYAPATANKMLCALRGVLRAAARLGQVPMEEYLRATEFKPVRGTSLPAGRALGADEVEALLRACREQGGAAGARDAALIATLYHCGLRRAEAVGLDLADWKRGADLLVVRKAKGNKPREIPLVQDNPAALRVWLTYRTEEPGPLFCPVYPPATVKLRRLSPQALWPLLQRRASQAGIEAVSPHDMRRTAITEFLDATNDPLLAQLLAGHASANTTRLYDRRGQTALRRAMDRLRLPL